MSLETLCQKLDSLQEFLSRPGGTPELRELREQMYINTLMEVRKANLETFAMYKHWYKRYKGLEEV